MVVGDVSGKGISGAIYMSKIISDFRYIALTAHSTKDAFERLNSQLSKTPRGMFLTAAYAMADARTGNLHISVAGHPPALLLGAGGLKVLDVSVGPPLGIMPAQYPSSALSLKEGESLVVVTDGVFECRDRKGRMLGYEGLVSFLKTRSGKGKVLEALLEHIREFSEGTEMADDLTIVEISCGGSP